jgi:hypothetical protein
MKHSLQYSQDPGTGPHLDLVGSNPHPHNMYVKDPFEYYPHIYANISQVVSPTDDLFPVGFPSKMYAFSSVPACYMLHL